LLAKKQKKFGLALGGGGARGLVHIGILDILHKEGIKIDCISGTSMGAILGANYALGIKPMEIKRSAMQFGEKKLLKLRNLNIFNESLIKSTQIEKTLDKVFEEKTFAHCKIPFRAIAVDIEAGKTVVLKKGLLKTAIRASSAIPFIFPPVFHEKKVLVDGGILDNVPLSSLKEFSPEVTMGVAINNFSSRQNISGKIFKHYFIPKYHSFLEKTTLIGRTYGKMRDNINLMADIVLRSFEIATKKATEIEIKKNPPDILLKPNVEIGLLEFNKSEEAIEYGRELMTKNLPRLKNLLFGNP